MAMAARMVMNTDTMTSNPEQLLILQNWFSPAFPVGAFSYSAGLETAIVRGDVHNRDSLAGWLRHTLVNGSIFMDAVFLRAAMEGEDVNDLCLALCAGAERHQETTELGAAFGRVMTATQGINIPAMAAYPVAVGMAARALSLPHGATVAAFLQGTCMNQISVAVRAVPIGQMDGQTCLVSLMPAIEQAAANVMETDAETAGSFAPAADLCAFEHETTEQRIYRT